MPTQPFTARALSLPLDGARVLRAAFDLASEMVADAQSGNTNFDRALEKLETAMSRCRAAFLAQDHHEADEALRYHERANKELADDFVPLYYRKAVLDNVAARYATAARTMLRATA